MEEHHTVIGKPHIIEDGGEWLEGWIVWDRNVLPPHNKLVVAKFKSWPTDMRIGYFYKGEFYGYKGYTGDWYDSFGDWARGEPFKTANPEVYTILPD